MDASSVKPKFDKKKWREKKYNNKVQVKHWEDKKKVILKSKLQRQLKKDPAKVVKSPHSSIPVSQPNENEMQQHPRLSRVKLAQAEFQKKQEEKRKFNEDRLKKKEGIAKALENYKKKKSENFRLLSKKTKKGQPVMKGRMQLLFEQVKKTVEGPR
uniref:Thyroid transcription factor 1-associated protein 26 n=1 Tax=Lygus hesperus TaxID=30085 RepID=A0A0A9VV79_LYGHE